MASRPYCWTRSHLQISFKQNTCCIKHATQKRGACRPARVTFALFLLACCLPNLLADQVKPIRRVVILNEVGVSYPLIDLIDEGIRRSLSDSPYQIEFYREYMETALFPDPADQQLFRNFYIRRYQNHRPDVIITVGPTPLKFMIETHRQFFPGIPVVFCLLNRLPGYSITDPDFTGIESDIAPASTVAAALQLIPGTKHVLVLGGTAPYDRGLQAEVKEKLKIYENRVDISYLTDFSLPSLLERLKKLPSQTIVLFTPVGRDTTGRTFKSNEIAPLVMSAANVPVFSLTDRYLNHGEVGGDISSGVEQGELAAKMAIRLLKGEKPKDVSSVSTATHYTFDWKALKRWGLEVKNLPPGSIVLNRPPTIWDSYKAYIIVGTSLIFIESILIGGLMWQRARRRQTSRALQMRTTELKAREELLKTFVKNVPAAVAMLDREMRYLQVSDRWCTDYASGREQIVGRSHYEIFADMPERWKEVHRRGLQGETLRAEEDRWDGKDGPHWARWEVRPWKTPEGTVGGILILAEDITRRKQMEEMLSGMSRRLIQAQEQERSRIGRELHDDINQRLALLAVELDRLDQSGSTKDLHNRLQESKRRIMRIASDVQAISHQIHSSKLEYLGLVTAAKSFCREISEMHNVRIDFRENGVPYNLPEELALCLFRVLQEALQNAIKYSGTDAFEVDLRGTSADIRLKVRDYGRGFSVDDATKTKGLGLVSMSERVNLVKGEIVIDSEPMAGTEITVRVPVPIADGASAATPGAA